MTTTNSDSSDSTLGPPPFVILDDTSELRVGDGWSQLHDVENAYNRTLSSLNTKTDHAVDNRVSIRFRGTGLRLVGRATTNLKMDYMIHRDPEGDADREPETFPVEGNISTTVAGQDGLAPFIWSLNDILPFQDNVVTIAPYEGELQLDYVAYMPASHQVNRRDVILVDNTHPYIQYNNGEDAASSTLVGNISSTAGLPFGGTWMRTSQTGSSFETKFRGSKVAVYGALNHGAGRLGVRYSLESGSPVVIHHFDSTHQANGTKWTMERLFTHTFSAEDARNSHRLRVTILECTGDQAFYLDYITYEAVDRVQSTIPPADAEVAQLPSGRFSAAHIAAIAAAVLACILLVLSTRKFLRYRHTKIRTRNAAEYGLHYQEPQPYPLQVLADRRREAALRDEEEALPPWSPPQNPENAPPPPEFEPSPRPSEQSPVLGSHEPLILTSSHPTSRSGPRPESPIRPAAPHLNQEAQLASSGGTPPPGPQRDNDPARVSLQIDRGQPLAAGLDESGPPSSQADFSRSPGDPPAYTS